MGVWHLGVVQKTSHMQCVRIVYISKIIIIKIIFLMLWGIYSTHRESFEIFVYTANVETIAVEIANKRQVFLFLNKYLQTFFFLFSLLHSYQMELRKIRRLMCYFAGIFFYERYTNSMQA